MKKLIIALLVIVTLCGTGVGTYFVTKHFADQREEQLTSQIATLNATIDAIGPIVTCYTVRTSTYPGQEFTQDMLIEQSIPESLINETFADVSEIVGLYGKVALEPGTPITVDMVMDELIVDSEREVDIVANRWPVGLREGDYVDVRITYPRGEDFIVLSHKRIMSITGQTLKIYMTEEEQTIYQAALVDFYTSRDYGSDLYLTKYIEPGIQAAAGTFYSVPVNIATSIQLNPNIIDMAAVSIKDSVLATITAAKEEFEDEDADGTKIKAGRDELNGSVNKDFAVYELEQEQEEQAAASAAASSGSLISGVDGGVG